MAVLIIIHYTQKYRRQTGKISYSDSALLVLFIFKGWGFRLRAKSTKGRADRLN